MGAEDDMPVCEVAEGIACHGEVEVALPAEVSSPSSNSTHQIQKGGLTLSTAMEFESVGLDVTELSALVCLKASKMEDGDRAPLHLSCVADKSGSMRGEKIKLMKETMIFLSNQLQHGDQFGIVSYDTVVNEDLSLGPVDSAAALAKIANIQPGSLTNLSGGILRGIKQHGGHYETEDQSESQQRNRAVPTPGCLGPVWRGMYGRLVSLFHTGRKSGQNKAADNTPAQNKADEDTPAAKQNNSGAVRAVLVFTDGLANQGITHSPELVKAVTTSLASTPEPCSVFTFGFGKSHNEEMLSSIAEAGEGSYYFIENEDMITEAFADALGGLLSVVAQKITIRICPAPGVVLKKVHTKYKNTKLDDGSFEVTLEDIYSEENRDFLIDLQLPKQEPGKVESSCTTMSPFDVTVSYFDLTLATHAKDNITAISIARLSAGHCQEREERNVEVQKQKERVQATEAMQRAISCADAGDFTTSTSVLQDYVSKLECSQLNTHLVTELKDALADQSSAEWKLMGRKKMCNAVHQNAHQRSTVGSASTAVYQNSKKASMLSAIKLRK
eukprot:gene20810-24943_t